MTICSVFSRFFRNHNKVFIVMFPRMQVVTDADCCILLEFVSPDFRHKKLGK